MLAIPTTAVHRAAAHFDEKTLKRGLSYAQDGRVKVVSDLPFPVVAHVRGTRSYSVTVDYNEWTSNIDGRCSCPVGDRCKHAAATLLTVLAREMAADEASQAREQELEVADWLAGIEAGEAKTKEAARKVIGYVLSPVEEGVAIEVMQATLRKRGGYGRPTAIRDPQGAPPWWAPPRDLRRIALIHSGSEHGLPRTSRLTGDVFRELADSGRLFWKQFGGPPLRYASSESDRLIWKRSGEQLYKLALASGRVLAPADPPHYIAPGRGDLGPLELAIEPHLIAALASGPAVPASMLDTVERSLRSLLSDDAARALRESRGSEEEDRPPPPLRLQVEIGLDRSGGPQGIEARPWAVYDEERHPLGQWSGDRATPRNMLLESYHARRLTELLDDLPWAHSPSEQLAAARKAADEVIPTLLDEGWQVELDGDFPFEPPAQPDDWVEGLRPASDSNDWFEIELGVVVAGQTVSLLPILLEAISKGELPLSEDIFGRDHLRPLLVSIPGGESISISTARLRRWLRPLLELQLRGLRDGGELVVPAVSAVDLAEETAGRFSASGALDDARDRMARLIGAPEKRERKSFAGELRPYQRRGLAWLSYLHESGFGGLLADDMGLGKTVQLLAFLDDLRARRQLTMRRPALVVAPRSVVGNWRRETQRFAPRLRAEVHLGPSRARSANELPPSHLVLTSYQTLLRDIELFRDIEWTTLLFDEAQAIKNPATKLRRAAASLRARSRFCVTGTPVENHLTELWSQIDMGMPGLLGARSTFEAVFRRPIEKYGDDDRLDLLRRRIRPFMLRRKKSDVELELPPKTELVERIALEREQRDLYESLRLSLDQRVRAELKRKGVSGSSMLILDALLKLRQCCCDPRLVKITEARRVKSSAKLDRLISMLEELVDAGRSTLVFSQFTSMLDLIESECEKAKIPTVSLTGRTRDREQAVDAFQSGSVPVFLISLKAGGTGLNLTRADTVIHYDPWWNPAAEDQATDRAHRIGQDKPVIVYKLVAAGTLEEGICALQEDKRHLTGAALHKAGISHLSEDDLTALFRPIV